MYQIENGKAIKQTRHRTGGFTGVIAALGLRQEAEETGAVVAGPTDPTAFLKDFSLKR
jgi:hypothetical protein